MNDSMNRFEEGDRVRVDIPNETDPDYEQFHGRQGTVAAVLGDDAGQQTGEQRDSHLFTVEFEDGTAHDFRWRDLRPAPEV